MNEPLPTARANELRDAVREKYRDVSRDPGERFPYPVGRESALGLGYEAAWLDAVPASIVDRFVGVGNPFRVDPPAPGDHVLDLGCGSGLDVLVAAQLVGAQGRVVGVDLTPEMIEGAELAAEDGSLGNIDLQVGDVETLPFEDGGFDLVFSNGVLNLVPDKDAAFREAWRVLKPGGRFVIADLLVTETVPQILLESLDAWST